MGWTTNLAFKEFVEGKLIERVVIKGRAEITLKFDDGTSLVLTAIQDDTQRCNACGVHHPEMALLQNPFKKDGKSGYI